MIRRKEPTLFRVRLLVDTAYNDEFDILNIKSVDNEGNIYYYDGMHRWCYLEGNTENKEWIRLADTKKRKSSITKARWISFAERMPEVMQNDIEGDRSKTVLVCDKNNCIWLVFWNGSAWQNGNTSDLIYFTEDYLCWWLELPPIPETDDCKNK